MKQLLVLLTILGGSAFFLAGCSLGAAVPSESGEIEIVMQDNTFSTDVIRVKAGDTITLVLTNEGDKLHEFMIGRDPVVVDDFTEGFSEGFFAGMTADDIQVNGPVMIMGLPAGDMAGMDMGNADEEMAGMDMGAADEAGDGDGEEHAEDVMGEFGSFQLPAMELHAGIMFMVDPNMVPSGDVTTITFTVPEDRVGRWEIGCFQERGQHYDDGMRGTFIVEPAA